MAFKLLFIGDVVGRPGRRVLANRLSGLCSRLNVDLVVANDVSQSHIGFNSDHNAVTAIWADGETQLAEASKTQIARDLIVLIGEHYQRRQKPNGA